MELKFQVQTRIQKPVEEVFDAVYNPDKLSGYFTNGGSSGPLDEGTQVVWRFADNPGGEAHVAPVTVKKVVPNELIVIEWEADAGRTTTTEMKFEKAGDDTIVRISESGWQETQDSLNRSYGNCMGWSHMVLSLKAFVEYGINLRKGAYEGLYSVKDLESKTNG